MNTDDRARMWWGYRHRDGSLQANRWWGHEDDLTQARDSVFVVAVTGPFWAMHKTDALKQLEDLI